MGGVLSANLLLTPIIPVASSSAIMDSHTHRSKSNWEEGELHSDVEIHSKMKILLLELERFSEVEHCSLEEDKRLEGDETCIPSSNKGIFCGKIEESSNLSSLDSKVENLLEVETIGGGRQEGEGRSEDDEILWED
ncbi:hypothetical protein MA16_Dca004322 [Dendrobium catenatum]|uniref:Uncharacterized protein n=1 Tax=Dendrobium catenatum TaxID=906689 RepID=A0A2I0W755_9ASPA|nr:hypothetical protein MA16_Dca004322 [Dendrobium catenatum]